MTQDEAIALVRGAVTKTGGTWADLGAGTGTFTRALASLLGPGGTVYAVDRDARALRALERSASRASESGAAIRTLVGDFTAPMKLPPLDGALLANALHFVPYDRQAEVLGRVAASVANGGPVVVVEYDRRGPNPWVPYPIALAAFAALARDAGLGEPALLATTPSRFSGSIYSVVASRAAAR
jgi:SAM-dependent methyltransferase